jgi:hypothetical protein
VARRDSPGKTNQHKEAKSLTEDAAKELLIIYTQADVPGTYRTFATYRGG